MEINKTAQTDPDLDELVASGGILSYAYYECWAESNRYVAPWEMVSIVLPSGKKLTIHSSSTPAPEASFLSFEADYDRY